MINVIHGKELKGFVYADGVHWLWGEREIAIITPATGEIEWCERKMFLPDKLVEAIKNKRTTSSASWKIDVVRGDISATQGSIIVLINGNEVANFNDEKQINDKGEWVSKYSDEELGKFVYSAFWHKLDYIYNYSETSKDIFYPKWRENNK